MATAKSYQAVIVLVGTVLTCNLLAHQLSDPTEIPPPPIARHLSHDPCRTVFSVVLQTIVATPTLRCVKLAYRSAKTGLVRGVSQTKPASQACSAIGGSIASNSIANRDILGQ